MNSIPLSQIQDTALQIATNPSTQYLTALQQELTLDPTGRGYSTMTAVQKALALNAPYTVMVPQIQLPRIAVKFHLHPTSPRQVMSPIQGDSD